MPSATVDLPTPLGPMTMMQRCIGQAAGDQPLLANPLPKARRARGRLAISRTGPIGSTIMGATLF